MNSLVQEASSTSKAIELAWAKAGKPQKFSVTIFQEAEKNFIGMTKQNAKIAIFFDSRDLNKIGSDFSNKVSKDKFSNKPKKSFVQKTRVVDSKKDSFIDKKIKVSNKVDRHKKEKQKETQELKNKENKERSKPFKKQDLVFSKDKSKIESKKVLGDKIPKNLWSDEMIAIARNWMKDILVKMEKTDVTFTTEVKRYHLKFLFNKPLAETEEQQKNIFRNFAHLIMQSVRNRLKKQLRYHKIVISSDEKK